MQPAASRDEATGISVWVRSPFGCGRQGDVQERLGGSPGIGECRRVVAGGCQRVGALEDHGELLAEAFRGRPLRLRWQWPPGDRCSGNRSQARYVVCMTAAEECWLRCLSGIRSEPGGLLSWRRKRPGGSTTTTSAPSTSCWV